MMRWLKQRWCLLMGHPTRYLYFGVGGRTDKKHVHAWWCPVCRMYSRVVVAPQVTVEEWVSLRRVLGC